MSAAQTVVQRTCRDCKHWCYENPYSWSREYGSSQRCKKLQDTLEIDIDQGSGWDCGGASIDEIYTKPDFGCNLFEEYK